MKYIPILILLILSLAGRAEQLKPNTNGSLVMEGNAVIVFTDSAQVYLFEPLYGKWRLVMWVGYIATGDIEGDTLLKKGAVLTTEKNNTQTAQLLAGQYYIPVTDALTENYPDKKKVALYVYVAEESILPQSRMEKRLEKILTLKPKKQWDEIEKFKTYFGFIDALFIENKYNIHFVFDTRSPGKGNDFRMVLISTTNNRLVAVAHDGYRPLQVKHTHTIPLDRKLTLYFVYSLPEDEQALIKQSFLDSYGYRD